MITGTKQGGTDLNGLYEGLKIVTEDALALTLVQDTEAYDLFEQDMGIPVKETGGGRYIEMSHYAADGGGFGARNQGGALPESTPPTLFLGQVLLAKNHMTVEMSGETMRRVTAGESAWISWAKDALPNAVRRLRHHLDRQSLGYAQGVLGRVSAIASAVITVDRAYGITGYTNAVFQFMKNDTVRFAAAVDGTTIRGTVRSRIIDLDNAAGTITIDNIPAGLAVGDYIAIGDSSDNDWPDATTGPKEMMGLMGIIDDGSVRPVLQNITRSANTDYKAVVVDANGTGGTSGVFKEDLLLKADDDAFQIGGGQCNLILGNRVHERAYYNDLKSRIGSLSSSAAAINSGGKPRGFSIQLNGRAVDFRVARKMAPQIAYMIETGSLKKWQVGSGFNWDTTTGSLFERTITTSGRFDSFYAVGVLEGQLGVTTPRHNVLIKNLAY